MSKTIIKPILGAIGSGLVILMLSFFQSAHANEGYRLKSTYQLQVTNDNHPHFLMKQTKSGIITFIVGSKTYQWQDLTRQQQEKLNQLKLNMDQVDDRLNAGSSIVEKYEAAIHELQAPHQEHDFLDFQQKDFEPREFEEASLPEYDKRSQAYRHSQQEHNAKRERHLQQRQEYERKLRAIEAKLHSFNALADREISQYVLQMIDVLQSNGKSVKD